MLKDLIETAVKEIDKGDEETVKKHAEIFKSHGIIPKMHVGKPQSWFKEDPVRKLEWYAGTLVGIAEQEGWFAVNTWLNMYDSIKN